jgi:hypothetical protein
MHSISRATGVLLRATRCFISPKITRMFSGRLSKAELDVECRLIAESLRAGGVNFLAIDFDRTFISAHTGGRVSNSLAT